MAPLEDRSRFADVVARERRGLGIQDTERDLEPAMMFLVFLDRAVKNVAELAVRAPDGERLTDLVGDEAQELCEAPYYAESLGHSRLKRHLRTL